MRRKRSLRDYAVVGWFVAAIPIGACRYTVGVQFGRLYDHVQIESARFLPVSAFMAGATADHAMARDASPSVEGMEQVAPYLFRCRDNQAFLMVPPPEPLPRSPDAAMMLAIVFRPIAPRDAAPVTTPQTEECAA